MSIDLDKSGASRLSGELSDRSGTGRTSELFLRHVEQGWLRGPVATAIGALLCATMVFAWQVGPSSTRWLGVGAAGALMGLLVIAKLAELQPSYRRIVIGVALVLLLGLAFYFGASSPFAGAIGLVLLMFNFVSEPKPALILTIVVALAHAVLSGLVASRILPPLGLVEFEGGLSGHLVLTMNIFAMYSLTAVFGQLYRVETTRTLSELEQASREIVEREALIREARLELEQAFSVGGRGRFTDQQLGSFLLGSLLGRGGMGEIYEATHVESGAPAAIKLLRAPVGDSEGLLARFEREAQVTQALSSAHVVKVLEIGGSEAPLPYIAMERLQGSDLKTLLRNSPGSRLSLREVSRLVQETAEGLGLAHAQGVVHRDIKPSNIFRARDGVWKVLDFGVARLVAAGTTLTGTGIVGTPSYMAPEQLLGAKVDPRADLHALGLVIYRALTGRPAYDRGELDEILEAIVTGSPVRPSELVDLPSGVDDVLLLCLAKSPEDRFQDAASLADAFARAAQGEPIADVSARAAELATSWTWRDS